MEIFMSISRAVILLMAIWLSIRCLVRISFDLKSGHETIGAEWMHLSLSIIWVIFYYLS